MPVDLVAEFTSLGLKVEEHAGWRTRGGLLFQPKAVLLHHTAGAMGLPHPSLGTVLNGRPKIPPPLCNVLVARDGVVHMIAARRANHAGANSSLALSEAYAGKVSAATLSAGVRHLKDDDNGNRTMWGVEVEHVGTAAEPWTDLVVSVTCHVAAAFCLLSGWNAGHTTLHRNLTARKVDPAGNTDWWTLTDAIIKEHS